MSVFLPGSHDWLANGWISRALFRDAMGTAPPASELTAELARVVADDGKTLNLEHRPPEVIREFGGIVDAVIAYNERLDGSNFGQAEFFPVYFEHLLQLKQLVEASLSGEPASAGPQS